MIFLPRVVGCIHYISLGEPDQRANFPPSNISHLGEFLKIKY